MNPKILHALIKLLARFCFELNISREKGIELLQSYLQSVIHVKKFNQFSSSFNQHLASLNEQNKTDYQSDTHDLTIKQSITVFIRLFDLIANHHNLSSNEIELLNLIRKQLNISGETHQAISQYISKTPEEANSKDILLIADSKYPSNLTNRIHSPEQYGAVTILKIPNQNQYFIKYVGEGEIWFNHLMIEQNRIYRFTPGSYIKPYISKTIYFTEVSNTFNPSKKTLLTSFEANNVNLTFPNNKTGLNNINITEREGSLISIMGVSGAGKTTLLSTLSGQQKPSSGEILINGLDLYSENKNLEGVIGYVSQDDLLFDELTIFQNLYYNAQQCFGNISKSEIEKKVNTTLKQLELYKIRNLRVGSPLDKVISGGQRKRLNIALELIREPNILFLDEPTSGLSSIDSENVIKLLKEQSLMGKLVFVVIHQPPSDVYKIFDKTILLDVGGRQIFYGKPLDAISHFQTVADQIRNYDEDCPTCGNVNPETVFEVIESKALDEYGELSENRKFTPEILGEIYEANNINHQIETVTETPSKNLFLPNKLNQYLIYCKRELKSKITNIQYVLLNLIEAPLLAFFLAFFVKHARQGEYIFRENDNIPSYLFISIVVSIFLGLSISAQEIFKDRKILKREQFLNLSRNSYLLSKISVLFAWSAIQSFLFVIVGNCILELQDMMLHYWLMLFTLSCCANVMGLIISATFNSVITIYVTIPILLIPQMILGGAMFNYNKLNKFFNNEYKVPVIAEVIPARWGYEGLMVHQKKNNKFDRNFYDLEQKISTYDYYQNYFVPEVRLLLEHSTEETFTQNKALINNELNKLELKDFDFEQPNFDDVTLKDNYELTSYLGQLENHFGQKFNEAYLQKEFLIGEYISDPEKEKVYQYAKNNYSNEYLDNVVTNLFIDTKIARNKNKIIRVKDPIFITNKELKSNYSISFPFYSPNKVFFGIIIDTYWYNLIVLWLISLLLYIVLYYNSIGIIFNKISSFTNVKKYVNEK